MSASASGPIGWLQPRRMPVSMSSAVARPSSSTKMASLIIGHRMRLTTKPGRLRTVIGVLPTWRAKAIASACAASEVCRPRMISSSAIIGTGLKKCVPIRRSGRCSTAASWVIEIDEVLLAITAPASARRSTSRRMRSLSSMFSVAASITRPAPAMSA